MESGKISVETETLSKTLIKPSSPTPQSLSRYNLSYNDQNIYQTCVSVGFFYENPDGIEISTIREQLQNSLSKTLVSYYPFAGKVVKNDYIHCNDDGIEFVEVRIRCRMNDILKYELRSYARDLVLPKRVTVGSEDTTAIVQLSHFDCGGLAVAFGISHKVADGGTIASFMKDWAASACYLSSSHHVPTPLLVSDSIFPRQDNIICEQFPTSKNCVEKTFIFPPEAIEKLKSKAVEFGIEKPTRVEVLTAFLSRCATVAGKSAAKNNNCGQSLPFPVLQAINLRPILELPQNSVGNLVSIYFSRTIKENDYLNEKEYTKLVINELRKEKQKIKNLSREKLTYVAQMEEFVKSLKEFDISNFLDIDAYLSDSWCRFPFYDVDFGWGKPIWVCLFQPYIKNCVVMMDYPFGDDYGIEAIVSFEQEKMSAFEKNEQLLQFVSN
uniref:Deacetylvindoline O-acetyltransferase n=1 Tax=Catharanthus roseus TaxID=4058 RepID=DAT_CATRO|nr:RecName: Full=Deacetylvindoline O-acetyltransferase; AltName: Full=Acetyl-coenzyme A:deacetylvindoline 4-O-acetyltransferase [Catharanthus roseus]AAC99311.1 deacetylvindoline 4-O-acetyltransferase [Catharanthus roseus]